MICGGRTKSARRDSTDPSANAIRTAKGETEGFLFYRGIGAFDPGLTTTVGSDAHTRAGIV